MSVCFSNCQSYSFLSEKPFLSLTSSELEVLQYVSWVLHRGQRESDQDPGFRTFTRLNVGPLSDTNLMAALCLIRPISCALQELCPWGPEDKR